MFINKSLVGDDLIEAKVTMVVPEKLHDKFPKSVRPHLVALESFIADVRLLTV